MENMRRPAVAGQFYEGNEKSLNERIKECFLDERGPKTLPKITKSNINNFGVVVPHAGYIYSGAIAAHSYNFLVRNGFAKTFIIIGPNHTGMGSKVSVMTEGSWLTPLGKVPINEKLAKQINIEPITIDENAHTYEHSIEVQLPFLQFSAGKEKFDFIPICMAMQDYETSSAVGKIITNAIKKSNEKIAIIASTDFSHAGFNYMSMPPEGIRVDEYAKNQDKLAIDQILKMDPMGLIDTVQNNDITMCGYGPVAATLQALKTLGAKKVDLLKYGTSYEVHPATSCVGYGAIAVY
ncbi:MAG: hypothetical protein AYK22_06580 [Thermoplasmatales archaeon SG8-52-3]|nr:MAG: hypothetical protein AYK22_06580 [Thermoplasmatales archaeon SG8-52-3]